MPIYNRSFADINLDFAANPVTGDLDKVKDSVSVKRGIRNVLLTQNGERLFNPEFGSGIRNLLFEPMTDLTAERLEDECRDAIKGTSVPIQIGFNRRFDSSHSKLQQANINNEIGNLEMLIITSRDPEPPGLDYLKAAGGFFRDTTIHDFDLARFILGDDPIIQVSAFGSQLISEDVKKVNDHDTAMFILKSKSGVLIHINNSRRAVYGYDQRVEIFGSKGMMISNNQTPTSVQKFSEKNTESKDPIHYFFIERYEQAYRDQFNDFVETIKNNSNPSVSFEDGRNALILANAAYESYNSGRVIDISYD